ncbi:MAG: cytochrome c biogenesis protein ResB, partial [Flavobacteriaceae bacterium]
NSRVGDTPVTISYVDFIEEAVEDIIPDESGKLLLKIVESGGGTRHEHFIEEGSVSNIHNTLFSFNKPTEGAISITLDGYGNYLVKSPFSADFMRMADQYTGRLESDVQDTLQLRSLYTMGDLAFVIPNGAIRGKVGVVPSSDSSTEAKQALVLNVLAGDQSKEVTLLGGQGFTDFETPFTLAGLDFTMRYGSKEYELPFAITLNDFIAEKYPGTEVNYSSFMSRISVEDEKSFDYDIYMNHVLDHKGYRFFQSSFFPDETGTVLSVNHDFWG